MGEQLCWIRCGPVLARLEGPETAVQAVYDALSVEDPAARFTRAHQFGAWDGKQRFLRRPSNTFLAGLAPRMARLLEGMGFGVTVETPRLPAHAPLTPRLYLSTLREYQEGAALEALRHGCCRVQLPTGSGKTVVGAEIIRRGGHPALWVVPRRALLTQTAKVLQGELGCAVGVIGDGKWEPRDVTVAIINSLATLSPKALSRWPVLIVDEAHHAPAPQWAKVLMASTALLRVGLSGTADVQDGNLVRAMRLEGLLGPVIQGGQTAALAAAGFLATPRVQFLRPDPQSYPLYSEVREAVCPGWRHDPRQLSRLGAKLFDETEKRGIVENKTRNALLLRTALRHTAQHERVLVLCHTIPHSERLAGVWAERVPYTPMWRVDGNTPGPSLLSTLTLFRHSVVGGLLIATPFFREGIDLPEIDALILGGGGASEIVSIQSIGRALRPRPDKKEVLIYDFWDGRRSSRASEREKDYLANHTEARRRTYATQQFEVTG